MTHFQAFLRKVKKGETPFFRILRAAIKGTIYFNPPNLPSFLKPPFSLLYEFHFLVISFFRWITKLYRNPLFESRCATVGKNLTLWAMPYVPGHTEIHLGDDVVFNGKVDIMSGRFLDHPRFVVGNRSAIGQNTIITVNREVIIEDDVIVSYDCRISDSDGHPREADLRAQCAPLNPRDMRSVRICRYAWIGNGTHITKGVTIGEGAIISANSVVISDIPPYCLAMGNPAEVYFRNIGRPKNKNSSPDHAEATGSQRTSVAPQE